MNQGPSTQADTETKRTDQSWMPAQHSCRMVLGGVSTAIYQSGKGSPVLLIHGSSLAVDARLTWFRLAPELMQRHQVISYDQPGFGESDMPDGLRYLDRLERARHAALLLEALDLSDLVVVGHSEGGFIATWLAIHFPQRVSGLVVIASGGCSPSLGSPRDDEWIKASARVYDYLARSRSENSFISSEERLVDRPDPEYEAVLRANFRRALQSGNVEMFRAKARASESSQHYTALQEREIFPHLGSLRIPSLLIWPGADPTVPVERGVVLAEMIPGSELEVIPSAGHWVMHDQAERFNRLINEWLERLYKAD